MQSRKDIKALLADGFKELVLEKPVEKITIKEITDKAGVIRVTFYNHFQDKYDLLEWIVREEIVGPARILLWNGMEKEALTFMIANILKNREFYQRVAKLEGQNSFESIIRHCFTEVIYEYFLEFEQNGLRENDWIKPEWVAEFYAQGMAFLLISWVTSGMQMSPEEMIQMYEFIVSHSMMDLPKKL